MSPGAVLRCSNTVRLTEPMRFIPPFYYIPSINIHSALFYRAQQYGLHAATVLIPMTAEGAELSHYQLLFQTLVDFAPSAALPSSRTKSATRSRSRSNRRFSTNDLIGTEDSLFLNDPELGNNLFVDDSERRAPTMDGSLGSDMEGIIF
jgi:hypothetical protein